MRFFKKSKMSEVKCGHALYNRLQWKQRFNQIPKGLIIIEPESMKEIKEGKKLLREFGLKINRQYYLAKIDTYTAKIIDFKKGPDNHKFAKLDLRFFPSQYMQEMFDEKRRGKK